MRRKNLSKEDQEKNKSAQDSLNKKFDQFAKTWTRSSRKNQNLKHLNDIPNTDLKKWKCSSRQREGSQNQNEGSPKKHPIPQKKAAEKMGELSANFRQQRKKG